MLYSTSHSVVKKKMHTPVEIFRRLLAKPFPRSAIYHNLVPFLEKAGTDFPIHLICYLDYAKIAAYKSILGNFAPKLSMADHEQSNAIRSIAIKKHKKDSLHPFCEPFSFTEGLLYAI